MTAAAPSTGLAPRAPRPRAWIAAAAALLLGAPWIFLFEARATDVSALRVAHGEVPYRDFWTMYAPGSFVVLAGVFRVLGEQLVWSNALGVLTSSAAAAAVCRLVSLGAPRPPSILLAIVFAVAFIQSGFHDGFTTYPPAILCVMLAFGRVAAFGDGRRRRDLAAAGLLLGLAATFKHDVAAYSAIACLLSVLLAGGAGRVRGALTMAVCAALPVAAVTAVLVALGAGPDAWQDLVVFPATDFRHVRPESFPILPPLPARWPGWSFDALHDPARDLCAWLVLHLPTLAWLSGLIGALAARRRLGPGARALVLIAAFAYPAFWLAAHVQINTHKVTMAGLAIVSAGVGLAGRRRLLIGFAVVWSAVLAVEPVEAIRARVRGGTEALALPRTAGIQVTHAEAAWMRGLHDAMAAGPPEARLLFAGRRNDVMIFADSTPFWLTDRRAATRHHELHPGITDTEAVQRRMIADADTTVAPIVVREHRFRDQAHDRWREVFQSHGVPVGSVLLDQWIAARYRPGRRFGRYELAEPR